jgi:hypothetical protein
MKRFEQTIEMLKRLGKQTMFNSTISLLDYAKLIDAVCEEYGKEKVMTALYGEEA